MIISKAIEILDLAYQSNEAGLDFDQFNAIKLGIEALKRIEYVRIHPWSEIYAPLPNETMPERGIR